MKEILIPALLVGGLGLLFGALLAFAGIIFKVKKDERIGLILEKLPGANCGGCGFAGCANYAESVAKGESECDLCAPGGKEAAEEIGKIMGKKSEFGKKVAFVGCSFGATDKYVYDGAPDCTYAALLSGGPKTCRYSCIGLGNCVNVCPNGSLRLVDGLPVLDEKTCSGCGACMRACPRGLITIAPQSAKYRVACSSHDKAIYMKDACKVGCIGCGKCTRVCQAGAIYLNNNVARIAYEKCTSCGACAEACPRQIIK